jgi:hypothetical protein
MNLLSGGGRKKKYGTKIVFRVMSKAAGIFQEVVSAKKILRNFPMKQTLFRCPYEDLEGS